MGAKIDKFLAKPTEFDFEGEKVLITPLSVRDYDLMVALGSPDYAKKMDGTRMMLVKYLKEAFPEAGDSVMEFKISHMETFLGLVLDANGMKMSDADKAKAVEMVVK